MRRRDASALLASLERLARRHGPGLAVRKLELLGPLARARLATPRAVMRLHELLCWLDAYPDDRQVRARARRMLLAFGRRTDLRRHRAALAGSGIAGTDTPYRFFFPTAQWISEHWPGALVLDRTDTLAERDLLAVLPSLLEPAQAEWVAGRPNRDYSLLDRLVPDGMTDADYVNGVIAAMPGDEFTREAFGDRLDLSYVLRAGRGTPERTTARLDRGPVHHQRAELRAGYPDLRAESRRKPRRIVALRGAAAVAAIRLARVSMITRERDVAGFQFANPRDVHRIDDGEGLAFAMMGMTPPRRATLPVTYTALTLKNGVPIGYVQAEILGRHAALSFNTFAAFRGGEAAWVLGRFVAVTHQWLGCTDFSIEPYQLGQGNEEGIESGAWWFYSRLGFRPRSAATRRLAARELKRRAADARYRSSKRTLRALARSHMLFSLDDGRRAHLPDTGSALAGAARALRRFRQPAPGERRSAAAGAAMRRLAGARPARLDAASRAALERWAGLVLAWTARGRWSRADRSALLRLIVAKAAASERRFQQSLLASRRLRRLLDC